MQDNYTFRIRVLRDRKHDDVSETRRFSLARDFTMAQWREAFGSSQPVYYSFDGDNIALRTDADIAEMLRVLQPEKNTFQLFCFASEQSFTETLLTKGKNLTEEAIVLGVRGRSYVENKFRHSPSANEKSAAPAPESTPTSAPLSNASADAEEQPEESAIVNGAKKVARGVKQCAEEVAVLGVRGYSYMEHELNRSSSSQNNSEAEAELEVVSPSISSSWVQVEEAPPAAPPVDPELQRNLDQMRDMGFEDVEMNRALLMRNKNNLEDAVSELLGQ